MMDKHGKMHAIARHSASRPGGFTLAELLVVIAMISMPVGIVLPSMLGLLTAGADVQAQGILGAMLGAARGLAIEQGVPTLVHVQIGRGDKCWIAIFRLEMKQGAPGYGKFVPAEQYPPRRMPGDIAFGGLVKRFISGQDYDSVINNDAGLADFTTFDIAFSPDGGLVTQVQGNVIQLYADPEFFSQTAETAVWEVKRPDETGVRAVTVFNYGDLQLASPRHTYLTDNCVLIGINSYTGQFLPTEQEQ